ncbi:DUF6573 family protein [Mangrovibacterium lignilyticum]|uniref:DUF6573 family protein n=1 Tax=Mangrovibacterium lignilyticum TaxID=2668052 RepID=UPI0013D79790|nr:DUF6573 family protein [Mangrovibacterium lignilyticum]
MSKEFQIISSYTTKQALADGVLVAVDDKISEEAGNVYPVLMTGTVWNRYIRKPDGMDHPDLDGRLWDLLFMFAVQARKSQGGALLFFKVLFQLPADMSWMDNEKRELQSESETRLVTLKAFVSAHDIDNSSPAIFIMLPGED